MSIKRVPLKAKSKINANGLSIAITGKDHYDVETTVYLPDTSTALIAPPGRGKTFFITDYIRQVEKNQEAVSIVFDAKGELYKELYKPGDVIISSIPISEYPVEKWSIFSEIYADAYPKLFAKELTQMIFGEAINESHAPVFPTAAAQIFYSILYAMVAEAKKPYNDDLIDGIVKVSDERLKKLDKQYPELGLGYLISRNETGMGIRMELASNLQEIFPIGSLSRDHGTFSIRNFIKNGNGRKLFIIFPFNQNEGMASITSILLDLAMKEIISGNDLTDGSKARFNLFLDEFACLPSKLQYLTRVNDFGRSKGARLIVGIQSYAQLKRIYGDAGAENILASFNNLIAFKPNDEETRSKLKERCGKREFTVTPICDVIPGGDVVTDNDLNKLQTAEAIMMLDNTPPFFFNFKGSF